MRYFGKGVFFFFWVEVVVAVAVAVAVAVPVDFGTHLSVRQHFCLCVSFVCAGWRDESMEGERTRLVGGSVER